MKLAEVVPWGRTLHEYERMFMLTAADRSKRILGVGDGPASFNAEMTAAGCSVVSVDPVYAFSAADLKQRIEDTHKTITEQLTSNAEHYVWTTFRDVEAVVEARMEAMNHFLSDYDLGLQQQRYMPVSLPTLPFPDHSYDIALCSHLLFLYTDQLSESFHLDSIKELTRVAADVRVFPIVALNGQLSSHLDSVLVYCQSTGIQADVIDVDYQFQKSAHQMLRLQNKM